MLALILGLAFFYLKKENEPTFTLDNKKVEKSLKEDSLTKGSKASEENSHKDQHDHGDHDHGDYEDESKNISKIEFDYELESKKIFALKDSFPKSREELLAIIKTENPFKKVRPHSIDEIHQRQAGAIKVLALKTIFEQESDKSLLKKNLIDIAQKAQDQTIASMAEAALEAHEKGRPFFKDYPDGLVNLPTLED